MEGAYPSPWTRMEGAYPPIGWIHDAELGWTMLIVLMRLSNLGGSIPRSPPTKECREDISPDPGGTTKEFGRGPAPPCCVAIICMNCICICINCCICWVIWI